MASILSTENFIVASGSSMSPQLRTVGKKKDVQGTVGGGGAVLFHFKWCRGHPRPPHDTISKNLPFRGKFFEMIKKKKTSKNIFRKKFFEKHFSKNIFRKIFFENIFQKILFEKYFSKKKIKKTF